MLIYDGSINKKDTLVLTGVNGPVISPISKLGDINDKTFEIIDEIKATCQIQVVIKNLEQCTYVIGSPIYLIPHTLSKNQQIKCETICKNSINEYLKTKTLELSKKTSKSGILVYASSFGGLTAIIEYLEKSNIPYIDAKVGTVKRQDILKITGFNKTPDTQIYNIIIAFDTKVEHRAKLELDNNPNVTLIEHDIIYRIFDELDLTLNANKGGIKNKYEKSLSIPCILEIMPEHIIARRNPIILGVKVLEGQLKKGCQLNVINKNKKTSEAKNYNDFISIGQVTNIRNPKGIELDTAEQNEEVSINIDKINPNDTGKLYGRDFNSEEPLLSALTNENQYIIHKYFYNDMPTNVKNTFYKLCQIYKYVQEESEPEDDY